ncbi:MAG: RagB/SusD family nutrient uptake outer membrane protein [Flaviaesturariibacter sp.]|nr:RagB/SusD family nutrient uptake outer membrane protein [Flaviaesturariibacter sp.]
MKQLPLCSFAPLRLCGSTFLLLLFLLSSCQKFLDVKSDKQLAVPSTLADAQAVLDNYGLFNTNYSALAATADDDYYLSATYFNTLNEEGRSNHTWGAEPENLSHWRNLYSMVFSANLVLEALRKIEAPVAGRAEWENIKGQALFHRAMAFYSVASLWAAPYRAASPGTSPGIPLRLSTDANVRSVRASLPATYGQITADLEEAAALLPAAVPVLSRPSKAAAYAALARVYLAIEAYPEAGRSADSSLRLYSTLIDYNTLNAAAAAPFTRFNKEVIFQSQYLGNGILSLGNALIDSTLYRSYAANDLRRTLFFAANGTGTVGFKGDYSGSTSASRFNGLAVDEMYLVRAEAAARAGLTTPALADLNTLLVKRWKTGTFVPYSAASADDALQKVLTERRKELLFRGTRWTDLRRLGSDTRFAVTLVRRLDNTVYELPPGSNRYVFLLPQTVIDLSGMAQNPR